MPSIPSSPRRGAPGTRTGAVWKIGVQSAPRSPLETNGHYQTSQPHIYAVGDGIGFPALASTSMEQARVAMVHAFNRK